MQCASVEPRNDRADRPRCPGPAGPSVRGLCRTGQGRKVLPPGVSKGAGVGTLLGLLGCPVEAALALGDAENDVEMLRLVGRGVTQRRYALVVRPLHMPPPTCGPVMLECEGGEGSACPCPAAIACRRGQRLGLGDLITAGVGAEDMATVAAASLLALAPLCALEGA